MQGRTEASTPDRSIEDVATLSGDPIVNEARQRLDRMQEWYSLSDMRFLDDIKFRNADSDNGYQWPNDLRNTRDIDKRPCLTINVTRQHNLQISNEMRQAKSEPKIVATGGGASEESAKAFRDLLRRIHFQSNAQACYTIARNFQVDGGRGWWRIITDWASPESWDQEIYIWPIHDPLSVKMDPDARQPDKSDARFALVFDLVPRKEVMDAYPELEGMIGDMPLGSSSTGGDWVPKDEIIICEYFRKVPKYDTLISFVYPSPGGPRYTIKQSLVPKNVLNNLLDDPLTKTRQTWTDEVEWYLIAGEKIIDETVWPGKYIPLIGIVGEEVMIDGMYDCMGHTRSLKDSQRMLNYNASAQVEFGALQTKVPWLAPIEAIEQYMKVWETANLINHSFLPYKSFNEQQPEKPIPPPQRIEPPVSSPSFKEGAEMAFNWMMMASGQWQNQMGMMGNERTGQAIQKRQDQGDTATFHFQDNYAEGLRYEAKQLIDLIPRIYDTKRVMRVMSDEGLEYDLVIDPKQRQSYQQELNHKNEVVRRIFNPAVGAFDVAPDVGPARGTKRQENVEALTLILTQAPALTAILGDLLLKSMDFEDAEEGARRLRRMIPPQALGEGPTQTEQQLQQQLMGTQSLLAKTMQRAGADRMKVIDKTQQHQISAYDAETDRMKALAELLPEDMSGLKSVISQLVQDALATHLLPMVENSMTNLTGDGTGQDGAPPVPGARQSPLDGEWYLTDPTRQGKYLKVVPLAQERKPRSVIANV